MPDVLERAGRLPELQRLPDLLAANRQVSLIGAAGSGPALLAAWLMRSVCTSPLLAICPTGEEAEEFAEDVNLFAPGLACHFPALEVLPGDPEQPNEAILKSRLAVLRHLAFGPEAAESAPDSEAGYLEPGPATRLVATCISGLMQPTRPPEELRRGTRELAVGDAAEPHELVTWLVNRGYATVPQARAPGEYCLRGGILDVFSHGAPMPVRIEFFGDEVDSIRTFEPVTQLSTERVQECHFAISEHPEAADEQTKATLLSYLPPETPVTIVEPEQIWQRGREVYEHTERSELLNAPPELRRMMRERRRILCRETAEEPEGPAVRVGMQRRDSFGPDLDSMLSELERLCRDYDLVAVYCISPAEAERFGHLLEDRDFGPVGELHLEVGRLNHGLLWPEAGMALLPHHRLFGRYRQRRVLRHPHEARPMESAEELSVGDLVVHVKHGVGRFRGTGMIEQNGRRREFLEIEFADDVRVHVPCDRIELVHRYVGIGGRRPDLSKVRGARWSRTKQRAEEAVEDLAAELLEVQALRETQQGIEFPAETDWQRQFASEFPYEETEDQLQAIQQVRRDMASPRPMDRLICGDVGYGKTEIAMRAAFRAVMGNKQVAMLVPTTILAQQHFRTFSERMADYPVRIEMLSRFLTGSETREVLEGMTAGQVDIVIGTHRLLQDDVSFRDLGLVIIDEEQRFGVEHKEKLKHMRATVDVLTLTATPIPRTLHMSLMGLREISALQTPPRERQAIRTRVSTFDPEMVRHAILRELNREGQVFVIHNRVHSIDDFAHRLREIVPEASIAVAHGQMPENQLAETMDLFREGEVDVLVSTTIVESGLDIPNANTIILNRADLLGLAEMHQLRGRVGRYVRKAYAYFFRPASRPITPDAEARLDAIRRYSQLGAGFDIALRDLEIRGAGNILGPEQSGHIAAVGYNLYCRLLARAAHRLKGEPIKEPPDVTIDIGLEALLPDHYVPTPRQKMEIYRQVNRAMDLKDVRGARAAMRDRLGPLPPEAENLLLEAELRILADRAGIGSIHLKDGRVHLGVRDAEALRSHFQDSIRGPRMITGKLAVLDGDFPEDEPVALAEQLRGTFAAGDGRR